MFVYFQNCYLREMQVLLTFDYEVFFGDSPGSVQKCLLEPTDELLAIAEKNQVPMTFFVDVGFILRMEEAKSNNPQLELEYEAILVQFERMKKAGCDIQLHIHPHWEKSFFTAGKWHIVTDGCYKLSDFSDSEAESIVRKYHAFLLQLTGTKITTYRAGGWCVQPFSQIEKVFQELEIQIDSTVFPGGKFESAHYDFDFTPIAPFSNPYRFQSDVTQVDFKGYFLEVPIASWEFSPFFYWRLYLLGRLNPRDHKMIGDGSFLAQPGRKKSVLLNKTWNHVSSDGYYASLLEKQARFYHQKQVKTFVVIGHPKGMTRFSLHRLNLFVSNTKSIYPFVNYSACSL
jgi:peptidoglycan/xylan/chitin deacetylase (PgdA/CDA1 family)